MENQYVHLSRVDPKLAAIRIQGKSLDQIVDNYGHYRLLCHLQVEFPFESLCRLVTCDLGYCVACSIPSQSPGQVWYRCTLCCCMPRATLLLARGYTSKIKQFLRDHQHGLACFLIIVQFYPLDPGKSRSNLSFRFILESLSHLFRSA